MNIVILKRALFTIILIPLLASIGIVLASTVIDSVINNEERIHIAEELLRDQDAETKRLFKLEKVLKSKYEEIKSKRIESQIRGAGYEDSLEMIKSGFDSWRYENNPEGLN